MRRAILSRITKSLSIFVIIAALLAPIFSFTKPAAAAPTGLPSGFSATTLINYNMTAPTSVRVAPDGRIFVFDLFGSIKIFQTNIGFNATLFGNVSVNATGDRGLLGAVFDRDFTNHPYVYVHYVGTDDKVRIGRFNAATDIGTNFTVLYTAPSASGFQHAGGGITMGPDNKIYFGIGDSGTPTNSQDLTKIHGKIHRINRDGTVPVNPFVGQAGVADTIYDYGVRNPFRLTTDSQTGTIYVGDVGFNTWEEINIIQPGKNYGWATQEGPCSNACPYENPIYWYPHQFGTNNTNDASIVAGPVYRGSAYPASYQGKMFVTDYVQGFIRLIDPSTTSNNYTTFSTANGTVIDMDVGPDGKLYFITINSPTIYRLDYNASNTNAAPVAQASADTTTGPAPLTVNFSSTGSSDPEGQPLSYNWNFGDGTTSTQANPTKTYTTNGQYTATLSVSDGVTSTPATALTIKVGTLPTVTITSPTSTTKYNGGNTINYSATATDSNGSMIPDSNLKTTVRLYHSDHNHPFLGPITGGSGQFTTPIDGELSPNVWLRITVEATDSNGITGSSYVEIQPNKSTITVNTAPAGLNVVLDGSNHIIPPTVEGVVGMTRQIAAPSPQLLNGVQYVFDHWSDGGARDHTFTFPATNTTYTAHYVPAGSGGTQLGNIAPNPSFETVGSNNLPTSWTGSRWGTNNATYTSSLEARTGLRSARLEATAYTNGEMRLYHTPVPVAPNTVHSVRYYLKSNVQTKAVADVTLADGTHKYIWLGINQPSTGTDWREQNWSLTTPTNAKNVVVSLYLVSAGYLQIDDFNLLAPGASEPEPPVVTAPIVSLSANPATITSGGTSTLTWSTTGTAPTCTASGAWTGSQTTSGTHAVAPGATSTYTLTCSNSAGSDSKSITVTVNPVVPPAPTGDNLLPNPSFEEHGATHNPAGWTSSKWGTNNATFSSEHGGANSGDHSVKAIISSFTSGEARWYHTPVTIAPTTLHTVSFFHKSNGPTKVQVDVTLNDGSHKYYWLGTLPAATSWTAFTKTFTTPANAKNAILSIYLTGAGSLQVDDVSLTPPQQIVAPAVSFSSRSISIVSGQSTTLDWSTAGTTPVCSASGAWSGSLGVSGEQVVSPTTTSTYTITCTNSGGTDTKSVTVTVTPPSDPNPDPTPATNLITNASMMDDPLNVGIPNFWYQGGWGNNITVFGYETSGRTDNRSISITTTDYIEGDAKWFFEPVPVTAGTTYTFNSWYKSTAPTELLAEYTLSDGSKSYYWLGMVAPAADWTQLTQTLTMPTSATKVTVMHILKSNGSLHLDDYSLIQN